MVPHASSAVSAWIEANMPELGSITNIQGGGGSGWSSTATYHTSSGRKVRWSRCAESLSILDAPQLFVKTSSSSDITMFKGEALGLSALGGESPLPQTIHSITSLPLCLSAGGCQTLCLVHTHGSIPLMYTTQPRAPSECLECITTE